MRDKLISRIQDLREDLDIQGDTPLQQLSNDDLLEILVDLSIDMHFEQLAQDNIGPPTWNPGDRVMVCGRHPATIVKQERCYDGTDSFWGNVRVRLDEGTVVTANSWQCFRIDNNLAM